MNGSCIECPPQKGEEEELVTISFYNDISQNPQIIEQAVMIPQNVHRILVNLMKYLQRWKRYRPLWKLDKAIVMEKFAAKKPPCVAYDEKLQFYARITTEVSSLSLLQGIFPTQEWNRGLLHCRQIFLPSEVLGKPIYKMGI